MYEDFWNNYSELSEFEIQVEEFKTALRNEVKKEIVDKITSLEDELKKLKYIKDNWNEEVEKLNKVKRELQCEKEELIKTVRKERLGELLKDDFFTAWQIKCDFIYENEKCDKCDDDRVVHFYSPSGKELKELCECHKQKSVYSVIPAELVKIKNVVYPNNSYKYTHPYFTYRVKRDNSSNEEEETFETVNNIADNLEFDKIFWCYCVFLNKEKAEAFCRFLNDKAQNKAQN